jgi:NADPH:quinone reductase-like Zn-dependent oxidoreductase
MDDLTGSPMAAVHLTGHGGFEKLIFRRDVPIPAITEREVLVAVAAAGVNATDINTRTGWYAQAPRAEGQIVEGNWSGGAIAFPLIQGADVCGHIVACGATVDRRLMARRVVLRSLLRFSSRKPGECWLGTDCNGGFAQYVAVDARDAHAVDSQLDDVELAALPCSYSTAENLLHHATVTAGDRVLVTGASGGVGFAAVQLARLRGAEVVAVVAAQKAAELRAHGADRTIDRGDDVVEALGADSIDVVIDLVGGPAWPRLLEVLKRHGRYATSGAIGGPHVSLDLRKLYLKDLTFFGCTYQVAAAFDNLLAYLAQGQIRPRVARVFPLEDIALAQEAFLAKQHIGKLVLVPPPV